MTRPRKNPVASGIRTRGLPLDQGKLGLAEAGGDPVSQSPSRDRLVGLVVKASASRAGGPGFESRLRRDFFGVESYQ